MISDSILQTLTYSDHFGFPLTMGEIHQRLIRIPIGETFTVARTITKMLISKQIEKTGEYYHLPGRSNLVERRKKNRQTSLPVFSKAKHLATKLSIVPGVLSIYLTGSLAMSNSNHDSDIDFMIITKNGHLWTTRFLLTIYTSFLGLRRTPHSKSHSAKLCLNLYLTPNTYKLPPRKRSLYTAYELIQAVPLYDPTDTRSKLLSANVWIHDYLPNIPPAQRSDLQIKRTLLKRNPRLQVEEGSSADERRVLMGTIEFILYHLQLLYMKNKITREHITRDSAFFHPSNPGSKILKKLQLE